MTALPHPAPTTPLMLTDDPLPEACLQTVLLFHDHPLLLDSGHALSDVRVAFHTYGEARPDATLVLHALTGTSAVHEWWPDFLGEGRPLDPTRDYVICANVLGGCAGTTGAAELGDTPLSLRDMVRVGRALLEHLGVRRVRVIGSSMGGLLASKATAAKRK